MFGKFFACDFQIFGGYTFNVINFASAIAGKCRCLGFNGIVNDFINGDLVFVPIGWRFFGSDFCLRFPFGEVVSAVTDDMFRLCPFVAVLFNGFLRHGIAGVVRQQVKEVRGGAIEFDLQGAVVYGLDAERFDILFRTAGNSFSIFYRIEDEGIFTACRRIDGAPPGIDEIARSYGRVI